MGLIEYVPVFPLRAVELSHSVPDEFAAIGSVNSWNLIASLRGLELLKASLTNNVFPVAIRRIDYCDISNIEMPDKAIFMLIRHA